MSKLAFSNNLKHVPVCYNESVCCNKEISSIYKHLHVLRSPGHLTPLTSVLLFSTTCCFSSYRCTLIPNSTHPSIDGPDTDSPSPGPSNDIHQFKHGFFWSSLTNIFLPTSNWYLQKYLHLWHQPWILGL